MSITQGALAKFNRAMRTGMGALFQPQQVDLLKGPTIQVSMHVGTRAAQTLGLTGGITQETQMVATIDADEWDTQAGREPVKGDIIHWGGKRYAVAQAHLAAPGGDKAFYKAKLDG